MPSQAIASQHQMLVDAVSVHLSPGTDYALVDFPFHTNVGDSAIWLGERRLLRQCSGRDPAYVCATHGFDPTELNRSCPDGPVFVSGGGNFGDLWPSHQTLREHLLETLPGRSVIQLPQSIHFQDPRRAETFVRALADHRHFSLMVRDAASLAWARATLDCPVTLVPDCVVTLGPLTGRKMSTGTLLLLRQDQERLSGEVDVLLKLPAVRSCDWAGSRSTARRLWEKALRFASAFGHAALLAAFDAHARSQLRRGVRLVSRPGNMVTDRLHAHLLRWMLARPQVVLDNSYGKVHGYAKLWTQASPEVQLADSPQEAANILTTLS